MANTANLSVLTTDLNITPYYDDYTPNKNFYRILFKPGFSVQARELTQMQTILQNQIDRFGKHIFQDGSLVLGGQYLIETNVAYVKVNDVDSVGNNVDIDSFTKKIVTGQTSGVKGYIDAVVDGVAGSANPKTIYVRYTSGNASTLASVFANGETLVAQDGTSLVVASSSATGLGSLFTIESGVFFAKQHFISFDKQTHVIGRYTTNPSAKVGFIVTEEIINSLVDSSLLDPALEASNYQAPGADRLKLLLNVTSVDFTAADPDDFILIFTIRDGAVVEQNNRPAYNVIRDEIAKRTKDESGDYVVRGMDIVIRENYNNGVNKGLSTTGSNTKLSIGVGPGIAYVKGYEVGSNRPLATYYFEIDKALTFGNVTNEVLTTQLGNYVYVNEFVGSLPVDQQKIINLYDRADSRITDLRWSSSTPRGNNIGSAAVRALEYDSGTAGTANGIYRLYLSDIRMTGTNAFSNVRSFYFDNTTTADIGGDFVLDSANTFTLQNADKGADLYFVGRPAIKTIRAVDGSPALNITYRKTVDKTINSDGSFTVSIDGTNEETPYGTIGGSGLDNSEKRNIIISVNQSATIALPGTYSGTVSTNTITGSGSTFVSYLNVGDRIQLAGASNTFIITAINSSTRVLTLSSNIPANIVGNVASKIYNVGDVIDLTTKGVDAGAARVVTTTSSQYNFSLNETLGAISVTVTYPVYKKNVREIQKVLRPNRVVSINCASYGARANTGPFDLGFSDIYTVRQIRKKTGAFSALTDGTSVTNSFIIDTGQRDDMYAHGTIRPKSNSFLTSADHLLVELDYFNPNFTTGSVYFSVDSYPVNDLTVSNTSITTPQIPIYRSTKTGTSYDLRNFLDFRPIANNTANDTTTMTNLTVSPNTSSSFFSDGIGLKTPQTGEQVTYDYSHYLSRNDLIVIDTNGQISSITGVPGALPATPDAPDSIMPLAVVYVTPYPSLSSAYAKMLNRLDLGCAIKKVSNRGYTMRDIGILKQRVDSLENYVSLNILEKSAKDMVIPDENGNDRFKNGIFADGFRDHLLGSTNSPDYRISVDKTEKCIRPLYDMDPIEYNFVEQTGAEPSIYSGSVYKRGDLIMLPYTETLLLEQPFATYNRNIETSSYRFYGNLTLDPEIDQWTDTQLGANTNVFINNAPPDIVAQTQNSLAPQYGAWQKSILGYKLYNADTGALIVDLSGADWEKAASEAVRQTRAYFIANGGDSTWQNVTWNNSLANIQNIAYWFAGPFHWQILRNYLSASSGKPVNLYGQSRIRVEEIQRLDRTGSQTLVGTQDTVSTGGTSVVNTQFETYMREKVIKVTATGLKANTKLYAFFDGENVSNLMTPASVVADASGVIPPYWTTTGAMGSDVITNANGICRLLFTIPKERFYVGTKELTLTDSVTNASDATTYATGKYTAQGLLQTTSTSVYTTRNLAFTTQNLNESTNATGGWTRNLQFESCLAYSFQIKAPSTEEGIFLTSFDIYAASVHPTLGVWFEIREMDTAGGITRNQVPFSRVDLEPNQINTSNNASVATNVTFPSPVFLQNGKQYALLIHTVAINPDTYFWCANLGDKDVLSSQPFTSRPLTGTLYTTNNNLNWKIIDRNDLKVKFYRANFATNTDGIFRLGNKPYEYIRANTISNPLQHFGEPIFSANDRLTLAGITGGTIAVGDILVGSNSGANSAVSKINGSVYTVANSGYFVGDNITVRYPANLTSKGVTANVQSKATGDSVLAGYYDNATNVAIKLASSNGNFNVGDTIIGRMSRNKAIIESFQKLPYETFYFDPSTLSFAATTCQYELATTANSDLTLSGFSKITEKVDQHFNDTKVLLSRADEISQFGSGLYNHSNQIKVTMRSTSQYVSPVLDMATTKGIYVHNIINNDITDEDKPSGGNLYAKYLSKVITLADGQDAEDLMVVITAYRPPGSNVNIWTRITNREDPVSIQDTAWIPMNYIDSTTFSSATNLSDFREYSFRFPEEYLSGADAFATGFVQYTNSNGIKFSRFKYFQIKIGLLSDDGAVCPKVADLRAVALQM